MALIACDTVRLWRAQEWDYTVLTVADPLTRLLDLVETVRPGPWSCLKYLKLKLRL